MSKESAARSAMIHVNEDHRSGFFSLKHASSVEDPEVIRLERELYFLGFILQKGISFNAAENPEYQKAVFQEAPPNREK